MKIEARALTSERKLKRVTRLAAVVLASTALGAPIAAAQLASPAPRAEKARVAPAAHGPFLQAATRPARHTARQRIFVLEPPAAYAHAYAGPVVERVLPVASARAACAKRGVSADGCSWLAGKTCHIVLPSAGAPVKDIAAYRRHELAHCNGWSH